MKSKRSMIVIVGFVVVVVVVLGIVVFGNAIVTGISGAAGGGGKHSWVTIHSSEIEGKIAQGLNVTTDQIKTQLQAGKTMSDLATAQNVSLSQLHTLELQAYQDAGKNAIQKGDTTRQQEDTVIQKLQGDSQLLDSVTGNLFLNQSLHLGV